MKIILSGIPIPKARPRFNTTTKRVYNSQANEMKLISFLIKEQANSFKFKSGPLKLSMKFYLPIPKSYSIKKRLESAGKLNCHRPDIDNFLKLYMDCITQAEIWADDSNVAEVYALKILSNNPRTEITIESLK